MREVDLARVVIGWLEDQYWDVYQEVPFRGFVIDIVATRGPVVWAVEVKAALNLSVLDQARRHETHARSVAVPVAKRASGERSLCFKGARDLLRLGVLEINGSTINEVVQAPLLRHNHRFAAELRASLRPEHKTHAKAGSPSPSPWTPYRATMREVARFLALRGAAGASLKEIMDALKTHHYKTAATARASIGSALEGIEKKWCRVEGVGRERRFYHRDAS